MPMSYQNGTVYPRGKQKKMWYGLYYAYSKNLEGEEIRKRKIVKLAPKSSMTKIEAREKLKEIIQKTNETTIVLATENKVATMDWFVKNRFLPLRRGSWVPATRHSSESEIRLYVVSKFGERPLEQITKFDIQLWLNDLALKFSDSIVRHCLSHIKSIFSEAVDQGFIVADPTKKLIKPKTRSVDKIVVSPALVRVFLDSIDDPMVKAIYYIGTFCGFRTSEVLGLKWKSYYGNELRVESTTWSGMLFENRTKTESSKARVFLPPALQDIIEGWRAVCPDSSLDALMFPTASKKDPRKAVPFDDGNFINWKVLPVLEKINLPRKFVSFQVLRRSLSTGLQSHGSMKDVQSIMRHASIKTTADVYMQPIEESTRRATSTYMESILQTEK